MEVGDRIILFLRANRLYRKVSRKCWASVLYIKVRMREIGFNTGKFSVIPLNFEDKRTNMNFVWEITYLTAFRIDFFFSWKAICLIWFTGSMTSPSWGWLTKGGYYLEGSVSGCSVLSLTSFKTHFLTSVSLLLGAFKCKPHIAVYWNRPLDFIQSCPFLSDLTVIVMCFITYKRIVVHKWNSCQ